MAFSLNERNIVIHYHYVEDPSVENGGMSPCPIYEFEKHIKFLSEHYRLATLEHTFEAGKNNSEERHCAITFDDGAMDQYINAVPILKRYKTSATFFVITETLEGILPAAHKLHTILSRAPILEVVDMWNFFLGRNYSSLGSRFFVPKDTRLVKDRRLYADIPTANLKETLTAVPAHVRDAFLGFVFTAHNLDERDLCKKMFMGRNEIKSLHDDGFSIGLHTHAHEPLDHLGESGFHNDFLRSKKLLKEIAGKEPSLFSYPYGIVPQWGSATVGKEGVTHAVTVEERAINANDTPLLIPRYDMASLREFLRF